MKMNREIPGRTVAAVALAATLTIGFVALIVASPWLTRALVDRSGEAGLLGVPDATARQWVIRNLWVAHWAMLWETRSMSRPQLLREFDDFFRDEASRAWWVAIGLPRWSQESDEDFLRTATESFKRATEPDPDPGE